MSVCASEGYTSSSIRSYDVEESSFSRKDKSTVDYLISQMSLEEKVGQVFISIIYGNKLDDATRSFIRNHNIGNFILFPWANDLSSFDQVKLLTTDLRDCALKVNKIAPFIAIDQEGGKVSRLQEGFTSFPGNREVARNYAPSYSYDMGAVMGKEMINAGINLNLAPVVDVCIDPSSWLAPRCYSSDPNTVIEYATQMMRGLHSGGVLTTLKHFPGHGDTSVNSHLGIPTVNKPIDELLKCELKPFFELRNLADFIMTAHIYFPSLDEDNVATVSRKILTDLLKTQLDYNGLIISDSLAMKAVVPSQKNLEEAIEGMSLAALKAFNAGCDLMILSKLEWADFETSREEDLYVIGKVIQNFKRSVEERDISIADLDASVKKILNKKMNLEKI